MRLMDLSRVPAPNVVEALDYESILAALLADFQARWPEYTAALESDPAMKLMEVAAWRELLLRARINEASQAGMLASARAGDLDQIAARYNTARKSGEMDAALRARAQIGFHQVAAAGSRERYLWHALDAHAAITQADAWQISPGVVRVSALGWVAENEGAVAEEDAAIGAALWGAPPSGKAYRAAGSDDAPFVAVRTRVLSDEVRPLGVDVQVSPPGVAAYEVEATLQIPPGPDPVLVHTLATAALAARALVLGRFRTDVHRSALISALMVEGVRDVTLTLPGADIARGPGQIGVLTNSNLTVEVVDD